MFLASCWCITDDPQWIELCEEHNEEFAGMHAAAMAGVSYVPGKPPEWYNPDPWSWQHETCLR